METICVVVSGAIVAGEYSIARIFYWNPLTAGEELF